jgi:hypothetical protein
VLGLHVKKALRQQRCRAQQALPGHCRLHLPVFGDGHAGIGRRAECIDGIGRRSPVLH